MSRKVIQVNKNPVYENGMVATVGRVRPCPVFDLKLVSVIHNAIRGAAGGSVLNAELLFSEGYIASSPTVNPLSVNFLETGSSSAA